MCSWFVRERTRPHLQLRQVQVSTMGFADCAPPSAQDGDVAQENPSVTDEGLEALRRQVVRRQVEDSPSGASITTRVPLPGSDTISILHLIRLKRS